MKITIFEKAGNFYIFVKIHPSKAEFNVAFKSGLIFFVAMILLNI